MDDHSDTTLTFKAGLESSSINNNKEFEVYTFTMTHYLHYLSLSLTFRFIAY